MRAKQSSIHSLAQEYIDKIEEKYTGRYQMFINSNRFSSLEAPKKYIKNENIPDSNIIELFKQELDKQKSHVGWGGEEKSFFISEITHFVKEANQLLEIEELKRTIAELDRENKKETSEKANVVESSSKLQKESKESIKLLESENTKLKNQLEITTGRYEFFSNIVIKEAKDHNKNYSVFKGIAEDFIVYMLPFFEKRELGYVSLVSTVFYDAIKNSKTLDDTYFSWCMSGPNPTFQIFCRTLEGKTLTLPSYAEESVDTFKKRVERREGIPVRQQSLIFGGQRLEDGRKLSQYKIQKESTVHLVLRLGGD